MMHSSEDHRTFVKCHTCGELYHQSCVNQEQKCLRCGDGNLHLKKLKSKKYYIQRGIQKCYRLRLLPLFTVWQEKNLSFLNSFTSNIVPFSRLAGRKSLYFNRKIFYEFMVPAYHEYIIPTIQKLKNRERD